MFFALILTCLIVAGGAFVTCFYDDDAPLLPRLAMGAGTGLAAWGLAGFVVASVMGLTPVTVILATLLVLAEPTYLWLKDAPRRVMVQAEGRAAWWRVTHPTRRDWLYGVYGVLMT